MNLHVKIAIGLVLVGGAAMGYLKWHEQQRLAEQQRATSDARAVKGRIVIGADNWIGYFPLCSRALKEAMRQREYQLECNDDQADYAGRMRQLKNGGIQLAVATVDSYLLNGAPADYPGAIIAVIDESRGGDALVAWKDQLARIEDLKAHTPKIAFTPNSPSEHLLKSIAVHFDVPSLKEKNGAWRLEANGSSEALDRLRKKQSTAAVLWEPDVSKALSQAGIVKLLGTEDTEGLIVDVLIVGRDFSQQHPEAVQELLNAYFEVLQTYADNRDQLVTDAMTATGFKAEQAAAVLKGVRWISLDENVELWFGGPGKGHELTDAIESTLQILTDAADFKNNPLPDGDPYRLINSQFLNLAVKNTATAGGFVPPLERKFTPLDTEGWAVLKEIGALRTRPIQFQSGTADLSLVGKQELDKIAENLKHYPNFRVIVKGHTGTRGDAEENRILSQDRAEAVARYFEVTYNMDANRIRVLGLGGGQPLPRLPGESERAYGYRLPRVEIALASAGIGM